MQSTFEKLMLNFFSQCYSLHKIFHSKSHSFVELCLCLPEGRGLSACAWVMCCVLALRWPLFLPFTFVDMFTGFITCSLIFFFLVFLFKDFFTPKI